MSTPPFLPLIDPSGSTLLPSLALLGPVLIPSTLVQAVLPTLPSQASYYVHAEDSNEDLISYLDNGAQKIVISLSQLQELDGQVPKERLILRIAEENLSSVKEYDGEISGIYLTSSAIHTPKSIGLPNLDIFIQHPSPNPTELLQSIKSSRPSSYVIPTEYLAASAKTTSTHLSIAEAFLAPIISDRPDGLFPTIVSSSNHSIKPLGLVYSSVESVTEAILTQKGVYQSRKHGLWRKGETSGAVQELVGVKADCDSDALVFEVVQHGSGFCHLPQSTCFGNFSGLAKLEDTLKSRLESAPEGSYTKRIFTDDKLLRSKIMEEAEELCDAQDKDHIAFEAADLLYFALARCISKGVSLKDVEKALDKKSLKITRRKGDAKPKWENKINGTGGEARENQAVKVESKPTEPIPKTFPEVDESRIKMRNVTLSKLNKEEQKKLLLRPVLNSLAMIDKVKPIVERVRKEGDAGLKAMTKQFDKADLSSNVLLPPFQTPSAEQLPEDVRKAIDVAYENVKTFHQAQAETKPLIVETMPGVQCSRFVRPIARVGVYVPGGTAILPSTAIMLGVPAQVAGCKTIVLATPPRPDGSISPEVLYVAKLVGVTCILKAGGAQAVGAMAYGTEEVPKVDKIFGPGNQWVTAAKMLVQNDTDALVAIDMPAGPSEVLVIADHTANPIFVASDLLSQAEHGTDSQVVLVGINLTAKLLEEIEDQIDIQAKALPRVAIAREAIKKSVIVLVESQKEAIDFSNEYAPEHLILHLEEAEKAVEGIENAGSVFVGAFSPESCGDYASGTNHTLPTNGFARQFSGVNTLSFQKHITSQLVSGDGLRVLGPSVVRLAEREGLEAHANAVRVRLAELSK
ncbi:histidinol dehydrogenase [Kwoniella dejecticola CBS 10117]|uniref:Histidine biosynthesis trifunctional protein n=1 Tax=Kwoniella dejecticola CBS 10117 TaxID=1296121 RepID=A0A1A6A3U2_9TREE|nr:histidinol dehydrogenase [Kwoniella dejecticola CBS 10117]OBR84716.1 histidinol dehydrogenase [Kwoniella dejecticola CBS 10117]